MIYGESICESYFLGKQSEKAARKEARANRKCLPKRDLMTAQIYKELIKKAEVTTYLAIKPSSLSSSCDWYSHQQLLSKFRNCTEYF